MSSAMTDGSALPSSLRQDQAQAVHSRILDATVRVIEAGEEPTMRAVAKAAAISERTVYRYFATRDDLQRSVVSILRERASTPMAERVSDLPDYIHRLFTTFENNASLVRTLLTAPWMPVAVTRPANLQALRRVIDDEFSTVSEDDRASAAASLRALYSAAAWAYLADCGFDLEASIRHVQWNTQTVLERLRKLGGGDDA